MTLHDAEELDDDLRGRTDEDLALATALGVDNVVLRQNLAHLRHGVHAHSQGSR